MSARTTVKTKNRKRSLHSMKRRPLTLKDRLRARISKASTTKKKLIADEDLIAERVSTRLEWARKSLKSFWRGESSTTAASTSLKETTRRPPRYELVMDANWWFWNLLLAASPSLVIMLYCELVVKPEMEQQQAQEDGFVPPPSTSFMDSLWLLVDWLQGRPLEVQPREDSKTTNTMIQNESHASPNNPHFQQIQELKQQLLALELELQGHGAPSNNPIAMEQHRRKVSPMNQRFQDRLRAQQEQDQQLPPPPTQQRERDINAEKRASENQSLTAKDRAQSTFSLAAIWASTVEGTKSMFTQVKEMIMETNTGVDQDRNQQQSQEQLQQRSDSGSSES